MGTSQKEDKVIFGADQKRRYVMAVTEDLFGHHRFYFNLRKRTVHKRPDQPDSPIVSIVITSVTNM
jgi:hypothetical protein